MSAKFEIIQDDQGRFVFRLLDQSQEVLLNSLPSSGKIAVQTEVLQARNSVRAGDRYVPHEADDGSHFVVLKAKDGAVLARSPHVPTRAELDVLIDRISELAPSAPLLDHARA